LIAILHRLSLRRICDSERSQEHRTTKSDRLDIWPRAALQFSINPGDVWEIPNVKALQIEKTGHPCQFPVEPTTSDVFKTIKSGGTSRIISGLAFCFPWVGLA